MHNAMATRPAERNEAEKSPARQTPSHVAFLGLALLHTGPPFL